MTVALLTGATSQQQVPQEESVQATSFVAVKKDSSKPRKINKHRATCNLSSARKYISLKRTATWGWQDKLSLPHTKTTFTERKVNGCKYLRWLAHRWMKLAYKHFKLYVVLSEPEKAICFVFGSYCRQALTVAGCESGHSYSVRAHNGQYLGMFQMGASERRKYGHGNTPLLQARAAYKYFVDSGKDWSPWSCKP